MQRETLTGDEIDAKPGRFGGQVRSNFADIDDYFEDKQISTSFADPIDTARARRDDVPVFKAYGIEAGWTLKPIRSLTATFEINTLHDISGDTPADAGVGVKVPGDACVGNLGDSCGRNAVASNANAAVRLPWQVRTDGLTAVARF